MLVLFTSDIHCGVDQGFTLVGLKAIKDTAEARGKHVLLVDGESLDPDKIYKVASLSYVMVDHGDGHTAFDGGKIIWESEKTDREILTDYITNNLGGVIGAEYEAPYGQERIVAVQTAP